MSGGCPREPEVVSAVLLRRCPEETNEDLRTHAGACAVCEEVAVVASLLREDHEALRADVRVPPAGQVWWRAAVRAGLEAAHAAARPITWLHGLATASTLGLAVAVAGIVWPSLRESVGWAAGTVAALDPATVALLRLLADVVQRSLPLALAIAACLVLAPLVLYFALADDRNN